MSSAGHFNGFDGSIPIFGGTGQFMGTAGFIMPDLPGPPLVPLNHFSPGTGADRTISLQSEEAAFETLFDQFDLKAFPFYNFWESDELTNEAIELGNKKIEEVPRYIKLSWKRTPDLRKSYEVGQGSVVAGGIGVSIFSDGNKPNEDLDVEPINSFLSPGTINAVVELPKSAVSVKNADESFEVDEDAFLRDPSNGKISIHEARSQLMSEKLLTGKNRNGILSSSLDSIIPDDSYVPLSTKVKFVDTGIDNIGNSSRINLVEQPHQIENISSISYLLSELEVLGRIKKQNLRGTPVTFVPKVGAFEIEYVGYIIEKYSSNGSGFTKVDEFLISDRNVDFFFDTKVAYGKLYRYRIKAVLRWTTDDLQGSLFNSSREEKFSTAYVHSEWGKNWAYATCIDEKIPLHPDELNVRPESHRKRIIVTCKIPDNSQNDITFIRIMRKTLDENGVELTGWVEKHISGLKNIIFKDDDVEFFQDSRNRYVYTAQCLTLHDEQSMLAEQFQTELSVNYRYDGEKQVQCISAAGVNPYFFGSFSTNPVREIPKEILLSKPKSGQTSHFAILGRNLIGSSPIGSSNYIVRIKSLDTGEEKDIPLKLIVSQLPTSTSESSAGFGLIEKFGTSFGSSNSLSNFSLINSVLTSMNEESEENQFQLLPGDRPLPGESW